MIPSLWFLFPLLYVGVVGLGLWLGWRFVEAFISIARSLEDIALTYRSTGSTRSSLQSE